MIFRQFIKKTLKTKEKILFFLFFYHNTKTKKCQGKFPK